MSLSELKHETIVWLGEWLSQTGNDTYEMTERLTNDIKDDLKAYMDRHGYLDKYDQLYRGTSRSISPSERGIVEFNTVTSWSLDPTLAGYFGEHVIETDVSTEDVLIDTTLLNPSEMIETLGGFPEEVEVILLPGNYTIKV